MGTFCCTAGGREREREEVVKQLNVNLHTATAENLHWATAEDCEDTRGFEASREQFVKLGGGRMKG